jgi:hypothetical protein
MRPLLAVLIMVLLAAPALAVEHTLLRWKKTGQCEIVTRLPLWGDHFVALGQYDSAAEAQRGLAVSRRTKACPAAKWAKRGDHPLDEPRPAITHRDPRTDDERAVMFRDWRPNTRR